VQNKLIFLLNTMRMLSLNRSDVTHVLLSVLEGHLIEKITDMKSVVYTCLPSKMLSKLVT